jgi:hypothetical protein
MILLVVGVSGKTSKNTKARMKTSSKWVAVLMVVFLCGCFQVQDELTLAPDGSGKVTIHLHSNLPEELIGMMGSGFGRGTPVYPPINESEARQFFPAKDFAVAIDQKSGDDGKTLTIEASFKDVNALLASAYGKAHQLTLKTNGAGMLVMQALSGGSTLAQAAQFKPEGEMRGLELPGMDDAQKKKNEMRFEFRLTLPNSVTATAGNREGKSVTWTVERAKCKDDDEFAAKLSEVLEASCSSDGLRCSLTNPPRLGLLPFGQLSLGKIAAASALPDTNKVLKAVRFLPCALYVTRAQDLSGEGSIPPSQAQLTGAILLPADLAPQRWGQVKLEEALDSKGRSLMPKDAEESMSGFSRFSSFNMGDSNDEEQDETASTKESAEKPRMITLNFKAPEWKVKQISRIKGVIELQYLGGSEVIKLTNAVPANLVMDMSKRSSFGRDFDSNRGQISDAPLADLGLNLRVQMAMVQGPMTMISLESAGSKATILDAQVFDASGRPWPTTLMQDNSSGDGDRSCQLMVAGNPKPPFSLALAVSGVGASVSVPILVENVPISDK